MAIVAFAIHHHDDRQIGRLPILKVFHVEEIRKPSFRLGRVFTSPGRLNLDGDHPRCRLTLNHDLS